MERLNQVAKAEKAVRALGFTVFRVRYHGELARLEVAADELARPSSAAPSSIKRSRPPASPSSPSTSSRSVPGG